MTETIYRVIQAVALGAVVIANALTAQEPTAGGVDEATRLAFQKARMAAEVEQDLPRAAKLFAELTRGAPTDVAKTRAWLMLADVQSRLGDAKAAEAALRQAAAGDGEAAARAQQRLASQDDLVQQAMKLLDKLRRAPDPGVDDQLRWLGTRVIPIVIADIDRHSADLEFVTRASNCLYFMKGPEVSDWLARVAAEYPVLVQRAVIRGVQGSGSQDELLNGLRGFAAAEDPTVLADALARYPAVFSKQQVVDWLTHEHVGLRERALRELSEWSSLRGEDSMSMRREVLEKLRGTDTAKVEDVAKQVPKVFRALITAEEVEIFMEFLRAGIPLHLRKLDPDGGTSVAPDRVVALARDLIDGSEAVRKSVESFVDSVADGWTRSSIPHVIELCRMDFLPPQFVTSFAVKHARGDDWGSIFELLPKLRLGEWITSVDDFGNATFSEAAFEPLRRYVDDHLAERPSKELFYALRVLAAIPAPAATQWLSEFLGSKRYWNQGFEEALRGDHARYFRIILTSRRNDPSWANALLRWTSEDCGGPTTRLYRVKALERLLFEFRDPRGIHRAAELLAVDADLRKLFKWLSPGVVESAKAPPREVVEGMIDLAVQYRPSQLWTKVNPDSNPSCPAWLRSKYIEHFDTAPDGYRVGLFRWLVSDPSAPGATELVRRGLSSDDEQVRSRAVQSISEHFRGADSVSLIRSALADPSQTVLISAIFEASGPKQSELMPDLIALTAHADVGVRKRAFDELWRIDPVAAEDIAWKLVDDPSEFVRIRVCEYAKANVNRRFAPALVDYLRNPTLHDHAQKALDAIRYYHEEKSRWDRIASGTDLTATSAAEALVQQATQTTDREVRLLAIRSLGTLAVPETLPVLIGMLKDEDAEVAKAVREAILAIQAAGSKK